MRGLLVALGAIGVLLGTQVALWTPPGQAAAPPVEGQTHQRLLPRIHARKIIEMSWPTSMVVTPDNRLFITERLSGQIRVYQDGRLLDLPFAQLRVFTDGEAGLLGIALDPDYTRNRFVYVFRTVADRDGRNLRNEVVRFRDDGNVGVGMRVLVTLPANNVRHNAGNIAFGRDGKMYVTLGDVRKASHAQDPYKLPGKVLRFNRDGTIPEDNPFRGSPTFAYGFRNPFDLTADPFTGNILAVENGDRKWDEVNWIRAGRNYGWPRVTGDVGGKYTRPLWVNEWTDALTGITVYQGDRIRGLKGTLLFCSWHKGVLRGAIFRDSRHRAIRKVEEIGECRLDVAEGPDGYLYLSDQSAVYRAP